VQTSSCSSRSSKCGAKTRSDSAISASWLNNLRRQASRACCKASVRKSRGEGNQSTARGESVLPWSGTASQFGGAFGTNGAQEFRDFRVTSATVKSRVLEVVLWVVLECVHVRAGFHQESYDGQVPPRTGIAEGCLTVGVSFLEVRTILDAQRHRRDITVGGCALEEGSRRAASIRAQAGGERSLQEVKTGRGDYRDRCTALIASTMGLGMTPNQLGQRRGVTVSQDDL
jgi:hypothetical protein